MKKTIGLLVLLIFSFFASQAQAKETSEDGTVTRSLDPQKFSPKKTISGYYDQILEPGFPVQTWYDVGSYHGGPAIHALVADITGDNYAEIIVTGLAPGPLYAFNHLGTLLPGFPITTTGGGVQYATVKNNLITIGSWRKKLAVFNGIGVKLWEHDSGYYVSTPGSIAALSPLSSDGFFVGEEDWRLHGYGLNNGSPLPGWPFIGRLSQEMHTPAVADINNDGKNEVISVSGPSNSRIEAYAIKEDGSELWMVEFPNGEADTFPVVGNIDNDKNLETIVISEETSSPYTNIVNIINSKGLIKRSWRLSSSGVWATAPALGDINGDGIAEIVTLTGGGPSGLFLDVTDGYGNPLPGWPLNFGKNQITLNSAPVIGDVDNDGKPEIVFTTETYETAYLYVVNHDGTIAPEFPLEIPFLGSGGVPAIADIDNDCRYEIIATGDFWNGTPGSYDKVWVFDLSRAGSQINVMPVKTPGPLEWGQFMSNAAHTGLYSPTRLTCIQ